MLKKLALAGTAVALLMSTAKRRLLHRSGKGHQEVQGRRDTSN